MALLAATCCTGLFASAISSASNGKSDNSDLSIASYPLVSTSIPLGAYTILSGNPSASVTLFSGQLITASSSNANQVLVRNLSDDVASKQESEGKPTMGADKEKEVEESSKLVTSSTQSQASVTRIIPGPVNTPTVVPEPATLGLLGCSIVALSVALANRSVRMLNEPEAPAGELWRKNT